MNTMKKYLFAVLAAACLSSCLMTDAVIADYPIVTPSPMVQRYYYYQAVPQYNYYNYYQPYGWGWRYTIPHQRNRPHNHNGRPRK